MADTSGGCSLQAAGGAGGPDGEVYLWVTDEAINVLVGALDTDVESAQIAAEIKLANLIQRGRLSIADLDRPISVIHYFGDLDPSGLRIPANASAVAVAAGLPAVRPAVGLYEALLAVGRPQAGQSSISPSDASRLAAWLAPAHRDAAARLLCDGQRLAQEAVGLAYLLRHEHWRNSWHSE